MERSAGLQLDGRGRLLVYPVSGIAHAAPAQLLPAETSDDALGEAILTAIAASEPDREDWEAIIAAHRTSCAQLGVSEKDFLGYPSVGFTERRRRRRRAPLIDLHGWKPAKGGWDPLDAEQMSVPSTDPAALGRAARNVLARIPVTRRTQHGERTGVAFGYKTAWLAARTDDTAAVARALQLTQVTELSWEEGIEASDHDVVFVSQVAAAWGIDPRELADTPTSSNTGLAGHLPRVETEHPHGRERLLERIDRLIASLSQPLSRAERKAGWSPEAATALLEHFEQVRDRLRASGALDPRTLPAGEQALRGMDAWGIDIASDSPLMREVLDLSHELRRAGQAGNQ